MTQYKDTQVVMLPKQDERLTNQLEFVLNTVNNQLVYITNSKNLRRNQSNFHLKPQHLYGLSDEPIKEGDWVIADYITGFIPEEGGERYLVQVTEIVLGNVEHGQQLLFSNEGFTHEIRFCKKIIWTTDSSLKIEDTITKHIGRKIISVQGSTLLPQPKQEFIKHFIEQYNKGNVITNVFTEYEHKQCKTLAECNCKTITGDLILKINSDNTVNIKFPVEDGWDKIIKKFYYKYQGLSNKQNLVKERKLLIEWLKENYNPPFSIEQKLHTRDEIIKAFEAGHDSARLKGSCKCNGTFKKDLNHWIKENLK